MDVEILPTLRLNLFCSHETRHHLLHHKSNFSCAPTVATCKTRLAPFRTFRDPSRVPGALSPPTPRAHLLQIIPSPAGWDWDNVPSAKLAGRVAGGGTSDPAP